MSSGALDSQPCKRGKEPWVGQPLRRLEDNRFLTGRATYVADIRLPAMREVAFLRSPHAHAAVRAIVPPLGREAQIFTREHLAWVQPVDPGIAFPGYKNFAVAPIGERVRYVGDIVAAVIADTRYEAQDLLEAVRVDFEELPCVTGPDDAQKVNLYDRIPENLVFEQDFRAGAVEESFQNAVHVFQQSFRKGRVHAVPLEPRGCVASFDPFTRRLTVWSSTQSPHELRTLLGQVLNLPESNIRVIAPDVGGGFGLKSVLFREEVIVAALAVQLKTNLRWVEDRRENLSASAHAREHAVALRWAADAEGRITAMHASIVVDVGAEPVYPVGLIIEPLGIGKLLPGPYRLRNYSYHVKAFLTNKCPVAPYRGVYMPTSTYVMERALDITARRIGIDPITIRRRNVVRDEEFPWETVTGITYPRLSVSRCLSSAEGLLQDEVFPSAATPAHRNAWVGVGVSNFIEVAASGSRAFHGRGMVKVPGYDSAEARLYPDGSLEVAVSGSSHGQGHRTALAQVAADVFDVSPEEIEVVQSDTARSPYGMGTYASRGAVVIGGAVLSACEGLKKKLLDKAAEALEAGAVDLLMENGVIRVRGSSKGISLRQLAALAYGIGPRGGVHEMSGGDWKHSVVIDPPDFTVSNGTHIARVAIDKETFEIRVTGYWVVEDCGRIINPLIVDGQIHGGIAQGLGEALFEEIIYDKSGQLLTNSLMDYPIPSASDVPFIWIQHHQDPDPHSIGGFKGMGESGTIGAVAAIANAVEDALAPVGITVNELPLGRDKIFQCLALSQRSSRVIGVKAELA